MLRERPALISTCVLGGCLFLSPLAAIAVPLLLVTSGLFCLSLKPLSRTGMRTLTPIVLGLLLGGIASLRLSTASSLSPYTEFPLSEIVSFSGKLLEDTYRTRRGKIAYLITLHGVATGERERGKARGEVLLLLREGPFLSRGILLSVRGHLVPAKGRYAFLAFSSSRYLTFVGWNSLFARWRDALLRKVYSRTERLSFSSSALLQALLLGQRRHLSQHIKTLFLRAGVIHLLALSGLHVGLIVTITLLTLGWFLSFRQRIFLGLLASSLYLFLAGGRPPLLRAVTFHSLISLSLLLGRKIDSLSVLGCSFLLLVTAFPSYAWNLSFQLSFLALLGIVTVGRRVCFLLRPYLPSFLALPIGVAVSAQMVVSPLLLFHFGVVYPIGVLGSLFASPLLLLFLWSGMVSMALPSWVPSPFVSLVNGLVDSLYQILVSLLSFLARVPGFHGPMTIVCPLLILGSLVLYILPPSPLVAWQKRREGQKN